MLLKFFIILRFSTVYSVYNGWESWKNNYSIIEITAFNTRERAVLYDMQTKKDSIIFLNGVTNIVSSPMYVMVSDCCTRDVTENLDLYGIEYVKVTKDSVLEEFRHIRFNPEDGDMNSVVPTLHQTFLDWDAITLWVNLQLKEFPTLEKIKIGETYESKELFVLKISSGSNKTGVFILAGEQGRDKMSTAVTLKFVEDILTTNLYIQLTNIYDLYIMPVFNPDGYEHSMKMEWYWNKNRKVFYPEKLCSQYNGQKAIGVNIDRNWFMSNSGHVEGAECDSVFLGHEALTEEEPRALALFLNLLAKNLMAFINVRGYGSLLTVPYAEANEFANNYAILSEILLHASNAAFIEYNVSCNLCSTHNCFYNNTGNAPDWVKKNMNIPVVFTLYLKHVNSFLPQIEHVPTLLLHFSIIVKKALLLAYDIYGPLFNCTTSLSNYFVKIVALMLVSGLKNICC